MPDIKANQSAACLERRVKTETPFDRCKDTLEDHRRELTAHLKTAMELEHGTIPPYLCALYSIKDGTNAVSAQRIRSVAVEEMLHMVLVANLSNALGERPNIARPDFILPYPDFLPESDKRVKVSLNRFSSKAVNLFLDIERPMDINAPSSHQGYSSIGQFYAAIKDELDYLHDKYDDKKIFKGDPDLQVSPLDYYSGGGEIVKVTDYDSARRAIKVIVDEGEGFGHSIFSGDHEQFGEKMDLAHFYKFNEIAVGRTYKRNDSPARDPTGSRLEVDYSRDAVHPAKFYPNVADYPPDVQPELNEFNRTYSRLLRALNAAFNEKRKEKEGASKHLERAVALMYEVKRQMIRLMKIPLDKRNTVGPTFKYVDETED